MKYIKLTASAVQKIISHLLSKSFECVIDGWSLGSQHFGALYAVFMNEASPSIVQEILLSCNVALSSSLLITAAPTVVSVLNQINNYA
jgi:hypothetical protein